MNEEERRAKLLKQFKYDRPSAHRFLFPHRHKDDDPAFAPDLLNLLYSDDPLVALMAFRGAAKSTYLEEYVLLAALFREAVFPLIIGPKWESACDHIAPMRHELETNDALIDLFGDQKSYPWSMDSLGLANGALIKALGAGQSMRGIKHNDERPDLAAIDDLEDEESITTEEARKKTDRWLMGTLIPALHPTKRRVRFIGTAIHPKALILKKCNDPRWRSAVYPLVVTDLVSGEEKPSWPSRFPMEYVKQLREDYINAGNFIEFEQEYMCRAEDIAGKIFQPRMIKVEPVPQVWMPTYMMVDPARTVKKDSARTGYAVWSWIGNRLIVHAAKRGFHKPDEIINELVVMDAKFKPVRVGVEAVGLEEFIMQPLRAKCLEIGRSIPWEDIRAPRDKLSFIKGLQPFYAAGDVIHTEHFPDLEQELLQFSTGLMDVLNALAYAPRMRAGRAVYEDFTLKHLTPVLEIHPGTAKYLCVSSRAAMTAGVLVQYVDGIIKIYSDWVFNEPPRECFEKLLRAAILAADGQVKVSAPFEQFDQYTNTGLPAAIRSVYITPVKTEPAAKAEGQLRAWLRKQMRGEPALLVHQDARWTVNGLSGGYARRTDKHGKLHDQPNDDQYRLVCEALESWVAWFDKSVTVGEDEGFRYAHTSGGQRYITLRPER